MLRLLPSLRLLLLWVNFFILMVRGDSSSTHRKHLRQIQFQRHLAFPKQAIPMKPSESSTITITSSAVSQTFQEDHIELFSIKRERPYESYNPTSFRTNGRRKLSWWNTVWSTYKLDFLKMFETFGITF